MSGDERLAGLIATGRIPLSDRETRTLGIFSWRDDEEKMDFLYPPANAPHFTLTQPQYTFLTDWLELAGERIFKAGMVGGAASLRMFATADFAIRLTRDIDHRRVTLGRTDSVIDNGTFYTRYGPVTFTGLTQGQIPYLEARGRDKRTLYRVYYSQAEGEQNTNTPPETPEPGDTTP